MKSDVTYPNLPEDSTVTALFKLTTRAQRKKLSPRDAPYYHELRRGLSLGYRRGTQGGSWLLREHRGKSFVKRRLGAADDEVPSDGITVLSWDEAQLLALGPDRPTMVLPGKLSVAEAADAYFGTRQGDTTHDRFTWARFIEPKLGAHSIGALTTGELEQWLADQVGQLTDREQRRAAQATANRRWTLLRAILNSAYRKDSLRVPSADAWRRVRPYAKVDQPRLRFLSATEARQLLKALEPAMRSLASAALYTGCRLGELLALCVSHVTADKVYIQHSKSGNSRHVPLSAEGAAFFRKLTSRRPAGESVFPPPTDSPWSRMHVSRSMRAACVVAKISPPATFHDLRRSYGSLMLNSGAPADVIQELLGHADLRMTRRAYAHLLQGTLAAAVEQHLPSFGRAPRKVTAS